MNIPITKPIIKWAGGKTQIINTLLDHFPNEMNNYREVFLGGGSVLLALLSFVKHGVIKLHGQVFAYDSNDTLIHVYKNIQNDHTAVYEQLQVVIREFLECGNGILNRSAQNLQEAQISQENYYYWTRAKYNMLSLEEKRTPLGSALFIFLNKTCFRGLYRVGPYGFNVPYGNYKNPEIINMEHLKEVHLLIHSVVFECCDFTCSLSSEKINTGDFIYLDPPYVPETKNSFVEYTRDGFSLETHKNLFYKIHELTNSNIRTLLSNSDVDLVREEFTKKGYFITGILCKRSIHSKKPEIKAKEVIVQNYTNH